MKRLLLFFVFVVIVTTGYTQSQRLVLLEEFTSATCGPCVAANVRFHTWQTQNPDKFTSIYYHVNWPSAGDPMNLANAVENGARVTYYGVTSVPESNLDGNYYNGGASGWSMTNINNRYAMPSPFEIQLRHQVSAGQDSVYSTMLIKCTQNINASMTAQNVIIEKWIHFNSAPCNNSNGERDFYNVMKKMIPGSSGTTIPSSMVAGDYVLLEGAWKFGIVYDVNQIASVGFVQNKNTKEIYQTANSTPDALALPFSNDLQVLEILNVPVKTCKNIITPTVKIRNNGNNPVTSMTIKYKVNDGTLGSYTWNGNLQSMQKTMVTLPEYSFDILSQNVLSVYTTSPNNMSDEYPKNDTAFFSLTSSAVSTNEIRLVLRTDNLPQDITWDVKNSMGVAVDAGGPFPIANHIYLDTITLTQADCYTFTIYDAGGNGICCANGVGVYEISSGGTIIKQGGQFGSFESTEFWMESPTTVGEENSAAPFNVYPNPFDQTANVSFYLAGSTEVILNLYSAFGQLVQSRSLGNQGAGRHETTIAGTNLKPGVYILQLRTAAGVYSRKISVIR